MMVQRLCGVGDEEGRAAMRGSALTRQSCRTTKQALAKRFDIAERDQPDQYPRSSSSRGNEGTMVAEDIKNFGFIGLGLMGKPMSINLASKLQADQHLFIFDLLESAMTEVCETKPDAITQCKSPQDVANKAVRSKRSTQSNSRRLIISRALSSPCFQKANTSSLFT